ncbi:acid protease, partial [Eremomyces bilateralis CBS 781.70]
VGSPPQEFSLQLDTGSSDIWLPWERSTQCLKNNACTNGAYDPGSSTSYKNIARGDFEIAYVDGTEIAGDYITDVFAIGDATVKNMTMGVATQATVNCASCPFQGIVGVGYPAGESIAHTDGPESIYPNLINQLKNQGYISSLAYSLWLNDLESEMGEILFGAVDTNKYSGKLVSLPVQPESEFSAGSRMSHSLTSFNVVLDNLNVANGNDVIQYSQKDMAIPVILDSGTTLTYLPDPIARDIAKGVGATTDPDYGLVVPCSLRDSNATLNFGFGNPGGPVIRAEISQFVLPFPDGYPAPRFRSGVAACNWGLLGSGSDPNLFGDTFLRSAYVVYDLEHNQVAIAQTVFNVTDSNVVEIVSGIPDVTSTASGVQVTQTATGNSP